MKMKLVAIALSGAMLSGTALGMDFDPKFYVGGEAQYNKLKNGKDYIDPTTKKSTVRKSTPGAGLFVGTRLTENVGAEIGYSALGKSSKTFQNNAQKVNIKMNNPYIDALGYVPVADDVDVIGSIGVGRLSTKVRNTNAAGTVIALSEQAQKDAKAKTGVRLGVGAQYKFDSNFGARAMIRHQKGNKVVKNVNSAGLGLFYQF